MMFSGARWRKFNFIMALVAVVLLYVTGSLYAMTPAATRIENRAEATYPWEGTLHTTWSNWVTVTVSQVAGAEIQPRSLGGSPGEPGFQGAHERTATPGQRVFLPYRLTNTGNGTDTYHLSIDVNETGATPSPALFELMLFHDHRGDGMVEPSDRAIDEITLGAGESVALILSLRISMLALEEDHIFVRLLAASEKDPDVQAVNSWSRIEIASEVPNLSIARSIAFERGPYWPLGDLDLDGDGTGAFIAEQDDVLIHTLTIDNGGYVEGTNVLIWEPLAKAESIVEDAYGPGQPLLISGTPVAFDGSDSPSARLVTHPDGQLGIEVLLAEVQSTQRVIVEYKTKADWTLDQSDIRKVATVTYEQRPGESKQVASNEIVVQKGQNLAVKIVPRGESLLPGAPNIQRREQVISGQRVLFEATVHNTGRTAGIIELSAGAPLPSGWTMQFYGADGATPLNDTNQNGTVDIGLLQAGESRDITIEMMVPLDKEHFEGAPYQFTVLAYFAMAPEHSDETFLQIDHVEVFQHTWDPLYLKVEPEGVTNPGTLLHYELVFGNASTLDARNVVIVERLSPYLLPPEIVGGEIEPLHRLTATTSAGERPEFAPLQQSDATSVTGVYDPIEHTITWTVPFVPANEGGRLAFRSIVRESAPEGGVIEVQGVVSSDVTTDVAVSNVVTNVVLTNQLFVTVAAKEPIVSIGDVNTYVVEVTNLNPAESVQDVHVFINLPPGLSYRAGSSTKDGQAIANPEQPPGQLLYKIAELEPDDTRRLTFDALLNVAADYEIVVDAKAMVRVGDNEWVESPIASVATLVIYGILSDNGIIVGRVILDGAENEGDSLQGVPGVRINLDNGRFTVSDQEGRFSFTSVQSGPRALRIDPSSLKTVDIIAGGIDPAQAQTKRVIVPTGGIAMVDFILTATKFEITTFERLVE